MEGTEPDALYFIEEGTLAALREAASGGEHVLAHLGPGELAGEMGFLDGAPRSASVRAETEARLTRISAERLRARPNGEAALSELRAAIAVAVVGRMREHNDRYVGALQREIATLRERDQFGYFYLYTLATMAIGTIVHVIVAKGVFNLDTYTYRFSWQFLTILLIPMAVVIWRMKIPLRGSRHHAAQPQAIGTRRALLLRHPRRGSFASGWCSSSRPGSTRRRPSRSTSAAPSPTRRPRSCRSSLRGASSSRPSSAS